MKENQTNSLLIKGISFILFLFLIINPIWSDDAMDNETLESILQEENTTIEMYSIPFSILSQFPIYEDTMREAFRTKIFVKNNAIRYVRELILTANTFPRDRRMNVRLLIDILVDNKIVYTIPISVGDGIVKEVTEAFGLLFGLGL